MQVLVTGSRGFIGSYITKKLLENKDIEVLGANKQADINLKNSWSIDLSVASEVEYMFLRKKPDVIIHCAGIADPRPDRFKIKRMIDSNIKGTLNLLEYCNPCHFINLSSIVVYGSGEKGVRFKEDQAFNPNSVYGISKAAQDSLVSTYNNFGNVVGTNLRLSAIVGPARTLTHGVIHDFVKRLKTEDEFYAIGKAPGSVKNYLGVDDLYQAIEIVMNKKLGGNYNICSNECLSIEELARACMIGTGINKSITWKDNNWKGDNPILNCSNDLIKEHGWKQTRTSFDTIVKYVGEE